MKKNIISRMKSKKTRLAAGVLAVILGMFPATTVEAQRLPVYTRAIQWINGVQTNPLLNDVYPNPNRVDNPSGWYATMSNEDVTYFSGNGLTYVTSSLFEYRGGYTINQNYNPQAATIPALTMRSGYYVSDALGMDPNRSQIHLLNSSGGSLVLTPWAGHTGESGTTADSYRAMAHCGGASTLNFINYNAEVKGVDPDTNEEIYGTVQDLNGAAIYLTAGAYTLRGGTTDGFYNSVRRNFNAAKDSNGYWTTTGNPYGVTQSNNVASTIYFDNNYATNGGAIYISGGSLALERVVFGYRYDGIITDTGRGYDTHERVRVAQGNHATDRGGAIYNANALQLSSVVFVNGSAAGTGSDSGGGALYNTTRGIVSQGSLTSDFSNNWAAYRGGAVYNQGTITIGASYMYNTAQFGGAAFNEGTYNFNGSADGALYLRYNWVTPVTGRGGAVYNDSSGIANFNNVRLRENTAIGGYGGAIYNQNVIRLTEVDVRLNKASRGGGIYNDSRATLTATTGVAFVENSVTENGGAIYNTLGTVTLSGTTSFTQNTALDGLGGAIYTFRGTIGLNGTEFANNRAREGGAIYNDSATLNIDGGTFNTNWAEVGDGGAIYNVGTDPVINISGRTRFEGNRAESGVGGAIYNGKLAEINLTDNDSSSFSTNIARQGGAIYNDEGGRLNLNGGDVGTKNWVTFSHNIASTGAGGAVYNALDGVLDLQNVVFTDNTAETDGGAIFSALRGKLTIDGGQFSSNVAKRDGGAIYNGENGTLTISNIVFDLNEATGDGGAIYNATNGVLTLTDVDFSKNTGGTAGRSGAIYNESATINVNVDTKTSSFGDGTAGSDTIFFTGTGNSFNVDVANNVDSESKRTQLVMYGAMTSDVNSEVDIVKTGVGTWEYRTASTFNGAETNFTVNDGTLHIIGGYSLNLDGKDADTTSTLTLSNPTGITQTSLRTFDGTASLIIQPGTPPQKTEIKTDTLIAKEGSSIVSGIVTLYTDPSFTVSTASAFTLDRTNGTTATINADTFKIDGTTAIIASEFSFLSEDAKKADPNRVNLTKLDFSDATRYALSGDGPILTLHLINDVDKSVTIESDIYVRTPQDFSTNGYGYIVLAEVTNNGVFNEGDDYVPTTGKLYVYNTTNPDGTIKWDDVGITSFTRTAEPDTFKGISVTSNADNTGSWIIYAEMDQNAKSDDLTWTGEVDSIWDSIDVANENAKANWHGTVHGIPVKQFLNKDAVTFADTYGSDSEVKNKIVTLTESVIVKSMSVTGTDYKFNLSGKNISTDPATGTIDFSGANVAGVGSTTTIVVNKGDKTNPSSKITAGEILFGHGYKEHFTYGLHFDTAGAEHDDKFLGLELTTGTGVIDVKSDIYVAKPTESFSGQIILVEATGTTTLARTMGSLYMSDGSKPESFERSTTSGNTFLSIDLTENDRGEKDKWIVLEMVEADALSDDLTWAGVSRTTGNDVNDWVHDNKDVTNWRGTVSGNDVYTFLNNDIVTFGATYNGGTVTNKLVKVKDTNGVITVADMFVTTTGYTFDLTGGGITAVKDDARKTSGSIDFGSSKIVNGGVTESTSTTAAILNRTIKGETIAFDGGNDFSFNVTGVTNGQTLLILSGAVQLDDPVNVKLGSGTIDIWGNIGITGSQSITLIDAGTNNVLTKEGTLLLGGKAQEFDREVGGQLYGLELVNNTLVLKLVDIGGNAALYWTGEGTPNNAWGAKNWYGSIGGNPVDTFKTGDVVMFTDYYNPSNSDGTPVWNKLVSVTAGGVEVGNMEVVGTGYVFDLSAGGITAKASGVDGANGNIDFGSANFGSSQATAIVDGTTVSATGTINFAGGNEFHFDLDGLGDEDTLLTLTASSVTGTVGDGNIYVWDPDLDLNETIILIAGGSDVKTGTLYVDGNVQVIDRNSEDTFYGLEVDSTNRLILTVVDASGNATVLWSGKSGSTWNTTDKNWFGNIAGNKGDTTFKTGDVVEFNEYYDSDNKAGTTVRNKVVNVAAGGVEVGNMEVVGTGYVFDLSAGGITATASGVDGANGNIDFGSANFGSSQATAIGVGTAVSATGTISFTGGNEFYFDVTGVGAGEAILNLTAAGFSGTIGDGTINVWSDEVIDLGDGETIILVNTNGNAANVLSATGELWVNGVLQVFERNSDDPIYGLGIVNAKELVLKEIEGGDPSMDLTWTGAIDGNWNEVTKNWKGHVDNYEVDNFLNNDSVKFDDTASGNRTVNVMKGGVTVGGMDVSGSGYTFNLADGGITARFVENSSGTKSTGSIDFGAADITDLSDAAKIYAEGNIEFAGGTINMHLGNDILIEAVGIVDLDKNTTDTLTLNINGFTFQEDDNDSVIVIRAGSELKNYESLVVTIDNEETVNYATARVFKENNDVRIGMTLSWYSEETTVVGGKELTMAHGDFDVGGNVTINRDLKDRDDAAFTSYDNFYNWDGTTLTKDGIGTLTLAGNNSYTGDTNVNNGTLVLTGNNTTTGTAVIGDSGTLVIQNANAVGRGSVDIRGDLGTGTLKVIYDGKYDQTITSTAAGNVIFGSVDGKLVLTTDNFGHKGKTTIETGTVRLETFGATGANVASTEITIADKATMELAGVAGLNPCALAADTRQAEFNKRITGLGNVTIDGGLVVLTNTASDYEGATTINGYAHLIADSADALGKTSGVELRGKGANAGTFTIGFGGEFTTSIGGTGNVYINPRRTGSNTTTLAAANTYTGDTILCAGTTLELGHIMGTGENFRGTTSSVVLRHDSTLRFAVGGDYYKQIVEDINIDEAPGKVVKTGGGKLSLWNANEYGGGTTIFGGELVARNAKAVGTNTVTLDGGNFSVLIDAENDDKKEFTNEITGEGNVGFGTTAGTLKLSGDWDYQGLTTITQGTVKLTNLGATGENHEKFTVQIGEGANADEATLILGAAGAYNKTISGSGTLAVEIDSDQTLTLTGTNSNFTGTAHLKRGTTELDNIEALGGDRSKIVMENKTTLLLGDDVEGTLGSSFTLVSGNTFIDNEGSVTLTGLIDGQAALNKVGSGTLKLSNANNSFAGLNIKGGRIVVDDQGALGNGTIRNEAQLELFVDKGRTVTLRSGIDSKDGTFIKSGQGNLDMGTKYAPFVADKFVMSGGSLEIQLGQDHYVQAEFEQTKGQSSELIGTYNTTDGLSRGSDRAEKFLALDGVGSNNFTTYTFNTNVDRVNGRKFYDTTEQKLYFELWLDSFLDAYGKGLSYNARQVADAADRLPEDNPLLNILEAFENDGGNMREAFSSLHGEVYMSSVYATADLQRNFNELLLTRRIDCEHCGEFKAFRGQRADTVQREVWATFTGGGNFRTKFDRFSAYNIGRWGVATGLEHQFSRNIFTGVALGYDQADLDMKDLSQKDQFYAFRASAYGNVTVDDVSVFGQFGYSKNWHDVERKIDFMGEKAKGKYNDDVITVGADVAKTYHVGNVNLIPSIGFNYVNLRSPFIEETGGGEAALFVHKKRYESFRVPMGVRTNSKFNIQNVDFTPEFRLFFVPEFGDTQVRGVTAFASDAGNSFVVNTGVRGSACLRVGLGMQAQLFDFLSIGVDYDAEVWGKFTRHDVGGNVRLRW